MNNKEILINFFVVIVSLLFTLIVLEVSIRIINPVMTTGRALMFDSKIFITDPNGAVHYPPDTKIKSMEILFLLIRSKSI